MSELKKHGLDKIAQQRITELKKEVVEIKKQAVTTDSKITNTKIKKEFNNEIEPVIQQAEATEAEAEIKINSIVENSGNEIKSEFQETGKASDEVLNKIAKNINNHVKMSAEEKEIYYEYSVEIEKKIKEIKGESNESETNTQTKQKENSAELLEMEELEKELKEIGGEEEIKKTKINAEKLLTEKEKEISYVLINKTEKLIAKDKDKIKDLEKRHGEMKHDEWETQMVALENKIHLNEAKIKELKEEKTETVSETTKEATKEDTSEPTKTETTTEEKVVPETTTEKPAEENYEKLFSKLSEFEAKRKSEIENGPLSGKMKAIISKGMENWENYGKNEEGFSGWRKRATKMAVNLALIGAISSLSVDSLAKHGIGTATALGGGVLHNVGRKMAFGLGLMEIGAKLKEKFKIKESRTEQAKKFMSKAMPWIMAGGSISLAFALTGGTAAIAAGASYAVGYGASKLVKGMYSNEKILAQEKTAKENFLKLNKEILEKEEGVDPKKLAEVEKNYTKLLKKYENQRFYGKLLDGATKLSIGAAVSGISLEASGLARDFAAHHINTETNIHPNGEEKANIVNIANTKETNLTDTLSKIKAQILQKMSPDSAKHVAETNTVVTSINNPHPNVDQTIPKPEVTPATEAHHSIQVEESSRGHIQTIHDLKLKIHQEYPDITKAPHSVQEFMKINSTQEAIKEGTYNPNNVKGEESALTYRGQTYGFDKDGNLSLHSNIKTGDQTLIHENGDTETVEKYHGKMFDSDKNHIHELKAPHGATTHQEKIIAPEPIGHTTGHQETLVEPEPINHNTSLHNGLITPQPIHGGTPISHQETLVDTGSNNHQTESVVGTPVKPEEYLNDTKHFDFKNSDHTLSINDQNNSLKIHFNYDKNGHVMGIDVGGKMHGKDQYSVDSELDKLSRHDRVDAHEKIFQMRTEAAFLEKLPRDTEEYQFLSEQVAHMQKNIIHDYGHVLNADKLEGNFYAIVATPDHPTTNTENTPAHITNSNEYKLSNDQLLHVYKTYGDKLRLIFTDDKGKDLWKKVRDYHGQADALMHLDSKEINPALAPIQNLERSLYEITGLKPEPATALTQGDSPSEYMLRCLSFMEAKDIPIEALDAAQ